MKTQRFERITGTCGRPFDTVNLKKEARHEAVATECDARRMMGLPTDFRTSAFDLFTNWLAQPITNDEGDVLGPYRIYFRETYLKIIKHIRMYRMKAAKQYAAGYFEQPNFLKA